MDGGIVTIAMLLVFFTVGESAAWDTCILSKIVYHNHEDLSSLEPSATQKRQKKSAVSRGNYASLEFSRRAVVPAGLAVISPARVKAHLVIMGPKIS